MMTSFSGAKMKGIKRISSEFIAVEDRIRLSVEYEDDEVAVLWLTKRLLDRLILPLCVWIENDVGTDISNKIINSFVQEQAYSEIKKQESVKISESVSDWLVMSIDINRSAASAKITFRGIENQCGFIEFEKNAIRQWLGIIHRQYIVADWDMSIWPNWFAHGSASEHMSDSLLN